jgi:GH24 family phage-related lysozyme (muramidase)
MAEKNVLRSFLIGLGFKIDDQEWKRFDGFWKKVGTRFTDLSAQAAAASLEIAAAVTVIADQLTNLYYISQRTGTSVGGLQAFQFGAKQIGLTAEQATSSLEGLAAAMRLQPGTQGVLSGLGIDPHQDKLQILLKLVDVLRRMPYYQGSAIAGMFGIDEQTFFMLSKNFDQLKAGIDARQRMASAFGLDPEKLAAQSRQFHNDLGKIQERFEVLGMVLARDFLPLMDGAVRLFDKLLGLLGPLDAKTHGWSTRLLAVAAALLSVNRALAAGRWLIKTIGLGGKVPLGGGAAAGEGALAAEGAAGGAEAAGAAGLGAIALPVLVVAAIGSALVWMQLHPDKVRAAAKAVWEGAKKVGGDLKSDVKAVLPEAKAHPLSFLKQALATGLTGNPLGLDIDTQKLKTLSLGAKDLAGAVVKSNVLQASAFMEAVIAKSEGFRGKPYWDVNGWAIGHGHHIQAGENLTSIDRVGADRLLHQDVLKYVRNILTKVHQTLNSNQLSALTSLEYNIGAGNFNQSTLLKKLNSGDFAGAAAQFERFNKVRQPNGTYLVDKGLVARRKEESDLFRKAVSLDQKTEINIHGVSDPQAAAREAAKRQDGVNRTLVRNLSGVIDSPGALAGAVATP